MIYVNANKAWIIIAVCLLTYWNAHFFLVYGFLCSSWLLFNTYVYCTSQAVARIVMEFGTLPSTYGIDAFESEAEYGYMLASTVVHVFCARSALKYWSAAMVSNVALGVWKSRLGVWVRRWNHCTKYQKLRTTLWCVILLFFYVLQWAYYATLPTATAASNVLPSSLHSSKVSLQQGDIFMWYTSTVRAAVNAIQVFIFFMTCFQHSIGYPLLTRWLSKKGYTTHDLEDTMIDPNSIEFDLVCRYVCMLFTTFLSWMYSPREMPLVVQILVLISFFTTLRKRDNLQAYQRILTRLQDIPASVEQACGICLDDFSNREQVKKLPCGHVFHGRCVRHWLHTHNDCPMCRQRVFIPVELPLYSEPSPRRETINPPIAPQNASHFPSDESGIIGSEELPSRRMPQHEPRALVLEMSAAENENARLSTASRPVGPQINAATALEDAVREVELKLLLATQRRQQVSELYQALSHVSDAPAISHECARESVRADLCGNDDLFQDEPLRLKPQRPLPERKRARSDANHGSFSNEELREFQRRNTRDTPS